MPKAKSIRASKVHRPMVMVQCPGVGPAWANQSNKGPRCTKCGLTGHDKRG